VESALKLFLSGPIAAHHSGPIPETVAFYTSLNYQTRYVLTPAFLPRASPYWYEIDVNKNLASGSRSPQTPIVLMLTLSAMIIFIYFISHMALVLRSSMETAPPLSQPIAALFPPS
jgi:hypothetical protein